MPELHMQMQSLGAGPGSRGSRMEQPPSLPHCLLHGRPRLVNFKASAAFGKGDVRGLFFPIFICFLVSLEDSEKGLPWYSLSRLSQWISPVAYASVWGDFTYLPISPMQGISLVAEAKSRIRSPFFFLRSYQKKRWWAKYLYLQRHRVMLGLFCLLSETKHIYSVWELLT